MIHVLFRKLLRDVAVPLALVSLLLFGFQCLWARVASRIMEVVDELTGAVSLTWLLDRVFAGPGQILQALLGGTEIDITRAADMISVAYVHPLTQTILCVWAVGRASGAVAGELDRGTMELLLAQPVPRRNLILAHLCVDWLTIPTLCLSLWAGTCLGTWLVGFQTNLPGPRHVDPAIFLPALLNVALLAFAVSGYTLALSACGRYRWRVMGLAVLLTLLQFLVNVIAQLLDGTEVLRYATVFFYYQPQPMALKAEWYRQAEMWRNLAVLAGVGVVGYVTALVVFCRRDLPAPL